MEAVSSEEEVRVRVKVIDEQLTILYSQDIDMAGRMGTFLVPAVITNTDDITVQVPASQCIRFILVYVTYVLCIRTYIHIYILYLPVLVFIERNDIQTLPSYSTYPYTSSTRIKVNIRSIVK